MKGIKVDQVGSEFQLTEDLPNLTPGPNQLLVKPIYGAVNPVDEMMRGSGLLVTSWPWTPCCDVAGTVVQVGSDVTRFQVGDQVFGCQGVGFPGSGGAAERCFFREDVTAKRPDNISLADAATVGCGSETAAVGVWGCLSVAMPDPQNLPAVSDEWVLVLGGGGNVGAYAVQLAKLSGYKVIATVSPKSVEAAKASGADETVDYNLPIEDQVAKIKAATKGGLHRIYDSTSAGINTVKKVLEAIKDEPGQKYFTSVNDWEDFGTLAGDTKFLAISLGPVARPNPEHNQLNADVAKYMKVIQPLLASGKLRVGDYTLFDKTGFEAFPEAVKLQSSGGAKKVVVKFQDE
ncbi:Zeta-crystallin [Drechslerella dactyloides]|uniref:Zeta-crystallin n=1 Tax=Drechslerella dactyloides TaxID=74499 RepID=A0AAD6J5R8_DREDA|nr:Zeta-crystallin [Drechslerella dactyloides]